MGRPRPRSAEGGGSLSLRSSGYTLMPLSPVGLVCFGGYLANGEPESGFDSGVFLDQDRLGTASPVHSRVSGEPNISGRR